MATMSIRGLDDKVLAALKRRAEIEGCSLNSLVVRQLHGEQRAPRAAAPQVFDDLDSLAGTWSAKDARDFARRTAPFGEVDPAFWK